jgi:hypothetical protein
MYGYLWRRLPGSVAIRLTLTILLILAVGLVLWHYVFPSVSGWISGAVVDG